MHHDHGAPLDANTLHPSVYSQFLGSDCVMHEFVPGDGFNAGEKLSMSVSSTQFISGPSVPVDALDVNGLFSQTPGTVANHDDVEPFHAFSNLDVVPRTNQTPSNMLNTLQWPFGMGSPSLTCNISQYELLGEGPANTSPSQFNPNQDSGMYYSQSCAPNIMEISASSEDTWRDVHVAQIPGFRDIILSTSKFVREGSLSTTCHSSSAVTLPDAYINLIQSPVTTTLLAFFHNACCLGIEIKDLLNHKSPFYSPDTTTTTDPQTLLAASRKPWMPTLLHPTLPQILIPHHPYIDLLPFPALRSRAITFAATTPQIFSSMDLKLDILRGGLYYHRSVNRHGCQQPWDIRSWKIESWFLTKWRLLVG